jgi:putative molybdopterin biosynthesis protein
MQDEAALTAQDVADILKIAKNTVYELIKRNEINSYKVGRKVRFTYNDVTDYIARSKCIQHAELPGNEEKTISSFGVHSQSRSSGKEFIICGQDLMLDVLSNYIERHIRGVTPLRSYIGSYSSLVALYQGSVQVATSHLWCGDTGEYNIPYVKRLLPGVPAVIIHLACRMQGFYVAKGNPKNITTWDDLRRSDITIINREKGAGSRVLLDEHLRLLGIYGSSIKGYERESQSHLTVASTVGRGGADVAIGTEKIASQVNSIDFIPLQKERYELVIKKEDMQTHQMQTMLNILRSEDFKEEFSSIGGYDTSEMGHIVTET